MAKIEIDSATVTITETTLNEIIQAIERVKKLKYPPKGIIVSSSFSPVKFAVRLDHFQSQDTLQYKEDISLGG